uniref:Uncharacterized protein n=1 Tax=Oryza rufipogon TaxID=4529 RepID=A0A0E0PTI2_ORYRU
MRHMNVTKFGDHPTNILSRKLNFSPSLKETSREKSKLWMTMSK